MTIWESSWDCSTCVASPSSEVQTIYAQGWERWGGLKIFRP